LLTTAKFVQHDVKSYRTKILYRIKPLRSHTMKNSIQCLWLALSLLLSNAIMAAPDVQVHSVQMPAWLQRDGLRQPLSVGLQVRNGDQLVTGANARLLLQSADGSSIKLGENATLTLNNLAQQRDHQPLFTALLSVARGAFRFTTDTLAKLKPREVQINIGKATIGIRGTDVWGKDGEDKGLVCLIEGHIAVVGADKTEFLMDQPLSFYEMPKAEPAKPVAAVDPKQLEKWAMETEIRADLGAPVLGGKWQVILLTANDQAAALTAYDTWRDAGYAVNIVPFGNGSSTQYQLRINHLPTRAAAQALAQSLSGKFDALAPKVSR
jgi:hypothetical protein